MNRTTTQPLTFLLVLMLLLSPIQSVLASTTLVAAPEVVLDVSNMLADSLTNAAIEHQAKHDCAHCTDTHECQTTHCLSASCASCLPGAFVSISSQFNSSRRIQSSLIHVLSITDITRHIYRPPRT